MRQQLENFEARPGGRKPPQHNAQHLSRFCLSHILKNARPSANCALHLWLFGFLLAPLRRPFRPLGFCGHAHKIPTHLFCLSWPPFATLWPPFGFFLASLWHLLAFYWLPCGVLYGSLGFCEGAHKIPGLVLFLLGIFGALIGVPLVSLWLPLASFCDPFGFLLLTRGGIHDRVVRSTALSASGPPVFSRTLYLGALVQLSFQTENEQDQTKILSNRQNQLAFRHKSLPPKRERQT